MARGSEFGEEDWHITYNRAQVQPANPSFTFLKNISPYQLIRGLLEIAENRPELNKNCNRPNSTSRPNYDLRKLKDLQKRGESFVIETDDNWYNSTEGDYFEGCGFDEDETVGCASSTSIYEKDEAKDQTAFYSEAALVPTLMSQGVCDEGGSDTGGVLTEKINQLLQKDGSNCSINALGQVDRPISVELMSNSFVMSADDLHDAARSGASDVIDSEQLPCEEGCQEPSECMAVNEFGPDLDSDDDLDEDSDESSDDAEDSDNGQVEGPISAELMSHSFVVSADDLHDAARPGASDVIDSEQLPCEEGCQEPSGFMAVNEFGPDLDSDDDLDEDSDESSDDVEDSDSGEDSCEGEEENEEQKGNVAKIDDFEKSIPSNVSCGSEHLQNALDLKTEDGITPVACAYQCIRGSSEATGSGDDPDDSFENVVDGNDYLAPCKVKETTTEPNSEVEHEAGEENPTVSSVWNDKVVKGAKYLSHLITQSLSNSDLDSSDSGEDSEDDDEEEYPPDIKGKLEISQNETCNEEMHNLREHLTNIANINSGTKPPSNKTSCTSVKQESVKKFANEILPEQTEQNKQHGNDRQIQNIAIPGKAPPGFKAPALKTKLIKPNFLSQKPIEEATKTSDYKQISKDEQQTKAQNDNSEKHQTPHSSQLQNKHLVNQQTKESNNQIPRISEKAEEMNNVGNKSYRFTPKYITKHKTTPQPQNEKSPQKSSKVIEATQTKSPTNKKEDRKRVNMAALLASKAKASMLKPTIIAKSETRLDDSKSIPKRTKSSMFERESYISKNREHNRKQKPVFRDDDRMGGLFSRLEIPKEGKLFKETGSSVDPRASPTKDPLPLKVAKHLEQAKKQAMSRSQQWRPRAGAASKQLVSLNENTNKPKTENHNTEQELGPTLDFTTESNDSNARERERIKRRLTAYKMESSGGVARLYQVGNIPAQTDMMVRPIQMNRIYDERHNVPKITVPTVIPEPPKAWYNPLRWLSRANNQAPPVLQSFVEENLDNEDDNNVDENCESENDTRINKVVNRSRGPAPLAKPKPRQPKPHIGEPVSYPAPLAKPKPRQPRPHIFDGGQYPIPELSDVQTAGVKRSDVKSYHINATNGKREEALGRKEAWKEASEKLRQERKQRLELLKQEGKIKESVKEVVPQKSVGSAPKRVSGKRTVKPKHMLNGNALGEQETTGLDQTRGLKMKAKTIQSEHVDNSNGNNCRSKTIIKMNKQQLI